MAVIAMINKIIPFSSVDGPGNRTAIFLQEYPDTVGLIGFIAVTIGVLGEAFLSGKKK